MINYQKLIVTCPTAGDYTESEGCFVTVAADNTVTLTTASTLEGAVYGLIHEVEEGQAAVILPGFGGIPSARLHSTSGAVTPGSTLALAANGTVKAATTGVIVATALSAGSAGGLVQVRLMEPRSRS